MKKSFYLLLIACGIAATFLFSTCEKDVKVSGIIVEPKSLYLSKGDVAQLAYMVTPYSADNKSIKWRSDDTTIATVSGTGLVTAISEGKTQITATTDDGHFTDVVSVTVMRGSPAGDSIALIKLYEIAAHNLPKWDFTKPMDQWGGVVLNSDRRVVYITGGEIYLLGITAPLDASIGNLTCLKQLVLGTYYDGNFAIPAAIGQLAGLEILGFTGGFSGTLPPGLGNLVKLKALYITYTQLTGSIPQELENLKNLQELYLAYNSLSGTIPQSLLERFGGWAFCPQNGTNFDNFDCK